MAESENNARRKNLFNSDEQAQIKSVSGRIDIADANAVMSFGTSVQMRVSDFVDNSLKTIQGMDMNDTSKMIPRLLFELRTVVDGPGGWLIRLFQNGTKNYGEIKNQQVSIETDVEKMMKALDETGKQLQKEIDSLERMYEKNKLIYKQLLMYDEAGNIAIDNTKSHRLAELQLNAKKTKDSSDVEALEEFENMIARFETKVYDLGFSKKACMETAPEIRMTQNNDSVLYDKILATMHNTFPNWKSKMHKVLDDFLLEKGIFSEEKSSDNNEKYYAELEALRDTNVELISALEEIEKIMEYGKMGRAASVIELKRIQMEHKGRILGTIDNEPEPTPVSEVAPAEPAPESPADSASVAALAPESPADSAPTSAPELIPASAPESLADSAPASATIQ